MTKKSKRAVVIGGSGFLGSNVADELTNQGFKVIILDIKKSNYLKKTQTYVEGSFEDEKLIKKIFKTGDYIFFYAGISDIDEASRNPLKAIEQNIYHLSKLINFFSKIKISCFIYASSLYVFNDSGSIYSATKQSAEKIIEVYSKLFNFNFIIIRYGSIYGPRSQSWNGIRKYIEEIIKNKKIEYHGTGEERREYIHVDDASKLTIKSLEKKYTNSAITISGQQVLTSNELLKLIFETINLPKKIKSNKRKKRKYHYTLTPYQSKILPSKKLVPSEFIDIGEGIYDMIEDLRE